MTQFIPGLELNRRFYQQVIRPLLDKHFPGLSYAAGILGEGSDAMGFDTPLSMDHNWGPHMRIFLNEEDFKKRRNEIDKMFRKELPYEFIGFPTNFTRPDEKSYLVQQMKPIKSGEVNHLIQFYTVKSFVEHYLGFDPHKRITPKDWLVFPQQALIEITDGEIYYDGFGELTKVREKFNYYPEEIWKYAYAIQWEKIGNIEAFMGRSGEVGDELGSHVIAADIVENIMKLCFIMEKQYLPYQKWFGSAFTRLKSANELTGILLSILEGKAWEDRQERLGKAYEIIAQMHNGLHITHPIKTDVSDFHGRPYKVIHALKVRDQIMDRVKDPAITRLRSKLGVLDQWVDHSIINRREYIYNELRKVVTIT